VSGLEAVLLADVDVQLQRWRRQFRGRPAAERKRLLLFALEREQIVAVAYREEAVAGRVADLDVGADARALIRQTLIWIWKDEQLHSEFTRGLLLESGGLASSLVVYGRQIQGALSGWTSATATNREERSAPFRTGAAGALVAAASALHRMPPALAKELRYQTFRRYCELNVALEASAEFAYRRLVQGAAGRAAFPDQSVVRACGPACGRGSARGTAGLRLPGHGSGARRPDRRGQGRGHGAVPGQGRPGPAGRRGALRRDPGLVHARL
jgi:hypothetical protein